MEVLVRPADSERRIRPEDTAHFPFTVVSNSGLPSSTDISVTSDDPRFDSDWVAIVAPEKLRATKGEFTLHVHPPAGASHVYGRYLLELSVAAPPSTSVAEHSSNADARFLLVVKPCVHSDSKPRLELGRGGNLELSVSLVNCGSTELSVSLTLSHRRSGQSQSWTLALNAGVGPVDLGELSVSEVHGKIRWLDKFDLQLSADGVDMPEQGRVLSPKLSWLPTPKKALAAGASAALLAVIGIGIGIASAGQSTTTTTTTTGTTATTSPPTTTTAPNPGPAIVIPSAVDCGSATVGSVANCTITVKSVGGRVLRITGIGPPPQYFQVELGSCTDPVASGGECALNVQFSPEVPGRTQGSVTIHQNLEGPASTVVLMGVGTVHAPSQPSVDGVVPAFGPATGGTTVTITGSNFSLGAGTVFDFGEGDPAGPADCATTTSCTVQSPAGEAGTVDVLATADGQTSTADPPGDQFRFVKPPTDAAVFPP
jgi:hypothetical protein